MAALPNDAPLAAIDRPRLAPVPEPEPFAWPKNDRLTLRKKVALLSQCGLWRDMDALAQAHGWESAAVARFIDAHLPKAPCQHCGTTFYAYSRRVRHCSDRCRRLHALAGEEQRARPAPATLPVAPPRREPNADACCVWLHREALDPADCRFYLLLIVQDLFGGVALVRQWGRDDTPHPQQGVTHYRDLADACAAQTRFVAIQRKRGYQPTPLAPGKGDLLHHAYQAAGTEVRA